MESESQSESHDGEGQGEDGLAGTGASTDPFSSKWQNLTTHRTNNQSREPNPINSSVDEIPSDESSAPPLYQGLGDNVWKYQRENDRTYHGFRAGTYYFPNDSTEAERLDFQHCIFDQLFKGKLHFAPLEDPKLVLDIGCGTGAWAIEMGDQYPHASIEGTDLSPIQPTAVPANVQFIIDDAEDSDWAVPLNHYDYIHIRQLLGCFRDFRSVITQAHHHTKPGGWVESQEMDIKVFSDDGTIPEDWAFKEWLDHCNHASMAADRPLRIGPKLKTWYIDAGFVDVKERVYKIPLGPWPKDGDLKKIGNWWRENFLMGLQGFSLAYFSREFGWSTLEIEVYLINVRKSLMDKHVHAYQKLHVVWGRKPEAGENSQSQPSSTTVPSSAHNPSTIIQHPKPPPTSSKEPQQQSQFILPNTEMEQNNNADHEDRHVSDISDTGSVMSDASAVFSVAFSLSSKSSISSLLNDAIKKFTMTIIEEGELQDIYQTAMSKYTEERFIRNHKRLLKRFFLDLATEIQTDMQRHAIRVLRGSLQRTQVSNRVFALLSKKNVSKREHMSSLSKQKVNTAEKLNNYFKSLPIGERGRGEAAQIIKEHVQAKSESGSSGSNNDDPIKEHVQAKSESSSSGSDNDDPIKETENLSAEELTKIVDFLITGRSFQQFKDNLHRFVFPPSTIREALASKDVRVLEKVLRKDFLEVTQDEYLWLREIKAIGYSITDIAELLIEQVVDTPWIFFDPQVIPISEIDPHFHLPNCAHKSSQDTARSMSPYKTLVQSEVQKVSSPNDIVNRENILKVLQQLCGLAGITPVSRDLRTWNGRVRFEESDSTSCITFGFKGERNFDSQHLVLRIRGALEGFCLAIGHAQAANCCCECFTILRMTPREFQPPVVEMIRIPFELALQLKQELHGAISLSGVDYLQILKCGKAAGQILCALGITFNTTDNEECGEERRETQKSHEIEEILHLCCLAVQFLCLGFISYNQAHCGTIHPFFLETPQVKIVLQGSNEDQKDSWYIETQLVDLTCVGEMVQGPVIAFSASKKSDHQPTLLQEHRFDILATPEDLVDTWGPGEFIGKVSETGNNLLYAIGLGGGIIKSLSPKDKKFHWSREAMCDVDAISTIKINAKLLIGATVTINNDCLVDETQLWLNSEGCLENLGTFEGYWETAERQAGIQSGQYITFAFLQTWAKKKATTLKEFQLSLPDNHLLPFLRSSWGLQVSCCTGIARRVSLCELLADVMPAFVESLFPIPRLWETLKHDHKIIQAFQSCDLQRWLGGLDDECQQLVATIIRYILSILACTGVDQKGENFKIAWVQKMKPFQCFKLSCQDRNYWTRILADSGDCATFAYITSKCLQTSSLACRGTLARWQNESTLLETAVCHHRPENTFAQLNAVPWILKHEAYYSMGTPDSPLLVKVERGDLNTYPRLYVTPSKIPAIFVSRLRLKKFSNPLQTQQRLRERQWMDAPAENVVVLTAQST